MTPSADGRSLPGASSTEPPPSFARSESIRRRNLLYVAFGVILLVGAGLGFAFGHDESRRPAAAETPIAAQTPTLPSVEAPSTAPAAPSLAPTDLPTEETPAASATPGRPAGGKRSPTGRPGQTGTPRKGPFVSPIRNPGF